jgi:hypothetical protein
MIEHQPAVHRTILLVDVEGFGSQCRNDEHRIMVRHGVYGALKQAFKSVGIEWDGCYQEDRGDGVLVLVPPDEPKAVFAGSLPGELVKALAEHNGTHDEQEKVRLRMALHAGEVYYDQHGVAAASVNLAFRLLDAPPLKAALAESSGILALIASPSTICCAPTLPSKPPRWIPDPDAAPPRAGCSTITCTRPTPRPSPCIRPPLPSPSRRPGQD